MQMEAGLDTGPVLTRTETPITATETTSDLHDRLSAMGARAIVEALNDLPNLTPATQPAEGVTYAEKISKEEARIDWTRSAVEVDRLIRGLSPFPGAWCLAGEERVKLLRSELASGTGEAGEILGPLDVACGEGAVRVTALQRAGKRTMDVDDAIKGWSLPNRLT